MEEETTSAQTAFYMYLYHAAGEHGRGEEYLKRAGRIFVGPDELTFDGAADRMGLKYRTIQKRHERAVKEELVVSRRTRNNQKLLVLTPEGRHTMSELDRWLNSQIFGLCISKDGEKRENIPGTELRSMLREAGLDWYDLFEHWKKRRLDWHDIFEQWKKRSVRMLLSVDIPWIRREKDLRSREASAHNANRKKRVLKPQVNAFAEVAKRYLPEDIRRHVDDFLNHRFDEAFEAYWEEFFASKGRFRPPRALGSRGGPSDLVAFGALTMAEYLVDRYFWSPEAEDIAGIGEGALTAMRALDLPKGVADALERALGVVWENPAEMAKLMEEAADEANEGEGDDAGGEPSQPG